MRLVQFLGFGSGEGLAQLGMDLQKIVVGDEEYSLKSNGLSYEAEGSVKEDAKKVALRRALGR